MSTSGATNMDASAIIDMSNSPNDDDDESDYESQFGQTGKGFQDEDNYGSHHHAGDKTASDDLKKEMAKNVTSYMWQKGTQQAKNAFNIYANIDILRPYFDVEPHEVRQRLLQSLIPQKPGSSPKKVPRELYGPTMLVFTMIALLLFEMKTSGHTVQEGTLMGSAFGLCFGYWIGVSSLTWFLAYICSSHITILQIMNLLGYALFGHCIILGLTTVIHTSHDHMFFYIVWAVFGGLSTLKMVSVLVSRTSGQTQKLIVCGCIAAIHLLFILYLHFAYHQIVEDISSVIDSPVNPVYEKVAHVNKDHLPLDSDSKKLAARSVDGP